MSKIENIAVLDIRDIKEEMAKEISEIKNVALLIGNDRSQMLLKHARQINIAETIKLPDEKEVSVIMQNGTMKIDREYLEGLLKSVCIVVNGRIEFKNDIDNILVDEKIHSLFINGEVICPKNLSGLIQSKATINGEMTSYSSKYTFMNGKIKLDNKFLKSIRKNSKLSFKKLLILEELDEGLLEEKIEGIEVLNKLIIIEEAEDKISQFIDDYYSINKYVISSKGMKVKYIDEDVDIDDSSLKKYDENILYVDGRAKFKLDHIDNFNKYIHLIIADKVICNEKTFEIIKESVSDDVDVEIVEGKFLENMGKMTLTATIEEELTIKNMGKLILDENLDYDSFTRNIISIVNYGKIIVPEKRIGLVQNKMKENLGKIQTAEESSNDSLKEEDVRDILYSNMAELKL